MLVVVELRSRVHIYDVMCSPSKCIFHRANLFGLRSLLLIGCMFDDSHSAIYINQLDFNQVKAKENLFDSASPLAIACLWFRFHLTE